MRARNVLRAAAGASWLHCVLAGAAGTALTLVLYVASPAILTRLDLKVYDALLPLRASDAPSPVPVIVDIDEKSLDDYGQWPWPRYLVADLAEALNRYGVAAAGFDILFAEPDSSSPKEMRASLRRDKDFDVTFGGLPENFYDYDRLLGETLAGAPMVLGAYARFDRPLTSPDLPVSISVLEHAAKDAVPYRPWLYSAPDAILPLPVLRAPIGLINVFPDGDGVVRQAPLLVEIGGTLYPSLSLRALMSALGTRNLTVRYGSDGLEEIGVRGYSVPVSPQGTLHIPFIGPRGTYDYVSASDVLRGAAAPELLEGRVAFVGTSAPGLLDIRTTPFDQFYPGVETHAAVLDAILTGNAITVPRFTPALQALGILLAGLVSTAAFGFARPRVYLPVAGLLAASAIAASRRCFAAGVFLSPLYVVLTVAALGALLLLLRFRQEERQKVMLRKTFSRYVSPEVVKRITRGKEDLFAGEERELSILFTDIRGFTALSEKLTPRQIVGLLNRYFTPMTALVRGSAGTLDKFIGDALMAYWNAPLDVPEHPTVAVEAALSMQERLKILNGELRDEFGVVLRIGAGIHTGLAYVGNMGSADLLSYTLIGDSVNLASRLEGLCPQYGVEVTASAGTRAACGDRFAWRYVDTINVKGKSLPVSVYAPLRHEAAKERASELSDWNAACDFYLSGNFAEASRRLEGMRERFPGEKLYAVYAERARKLQADPPENWNGVWVLASK
ncbi:MAG: adenylate/guanylate cyclase domain-containing protein [Synergistaceae bacterium]|jgi:adenylate cyclase|nr:adenylate/guanylate cyclase domain-containing protein [Synergistaceae bacterium]